MIPYESRSVRANAARIEEVAVIEPEPDARQSLTFGKKRDRSSTSQEPSLSMDICILVADD